MSTHFAENRVLLGCYAASSGNFIPTFRDNLSIACPGIKNFDRKGGTNRSSRNTRKKLPLLAAFNRVQAIAGKGDTTYPYTFPSLKSHIT